MAQPTTIHSSYAGMAQDFARDEMPPSTLWNLIDYIPNILGAPLRKRGGYVYASSAVTAGSFLRRAMYGTMATGGSQLLVIDSITAGSAGAGLWSVSETTGAVTFVGSVTAASAGAASGNASVGDPVYFGKQWFIPVGYLDSYTPTGSVNATSALGCAVYDGTTLTKITAVSGGGNTAYGARYAAVYKNRVVLANTPSGARRLWFSKSGDTSGTDFTDADAWLHAPMQVTGLAAIPSCLLVFGADRTSRIRGSVPPPGSDFVIDDLNDQGCADYRSIATWSGKCVYANTNGVILTDGISTVDLTLQAGMSNYYRSLLTSFTASWRLRGQVFRNYYFLSISNASDTFVDCLVCDLRNRTFFRLSNMNFHGMSVGTGSNFQQFYAAPAATNKLIRLTDIFTPAVANKADADGTAILPVVEYPCRKGYAKQGRRFVETGGLTHWKRLYLTYDLRDAASDNPTLQVSYVETPDSSSYTALAKTLAETATQTRGPFDFGPSGERGGKIVDSLGLKVTQTAASSDTRIYQMEAENEAIEGSR